MKWKITSFENDDFNCCFMPVECEADHREAYRYAEERLENGWHDLAWMPFGSRVIVTMEVCAGEITDFDNEEDDQRPSEACGMVGVCWDKATTKWRAQATLDGKSMILGLFDDIHNAATAVATFRADNGIPRGDE